MQQLVIANAVSRFECLFGDMEKAGWRIVPGTMGATSVEQVYKHPFTTPLKATTPAGTYFEVLIWCVMEKQDDT